MSDNKGVMIYGEIAEGKLAGITTELLGCGRKLADALGEQVSIVLAGSGIGALAQEAIAFGADRVFVVDDPLCKDYRNDASVQIMEKMAKENNPAIILMGQTAIGRDLAPRLAFRLGSIATLDCVELSIDPASKLLVQTKPVYGGSALASFTTNTMPQVVSVRIKTQSPLEKNPARQGTVTNVPAGLDAASIRTSVLERVKQEVEGIKLEDAEVIVCGGRGIGGPDGFKQLGALAKTLKGALGATRPPCDNGWVPETIQIGLTGKIVAPRLYIAVALSGSSQHMSGCSGSKTIIAINKDPECNIFKVAQFGVVGDWKKVIPAFNTKVTELLAG